MLLYMIPIFIIDTLFVLWLGFGGKRNDFERYEVKLRVLCSIVFAASISLVEAVFAVSFLMKYGDDSPYILSASLSIYLFCPAIISLWVLVRLPAIFMMEYHPEENNADTSLTDDAFLTASLSNQMGLQKLPSLAITSQPILWPKTITTTPRSSYIVFPPYINAVIANVSHIAKVDPAFLRRFILAHELSHIINYDSYFLYWAKHFMRRMNKCTIYMLLFTIAYTLISILSQAMNGRPAFDNIQYIMLWLALAASNLSLLAFSLQCTAIRRRSESQADSSAWLHLALLGFNYEKDKIVGLFRILAQQPPANTLLDDHDPSTASALATAKIFIKKIFRALSRLGYNVAIFMTAKYNIDRERYLESALEETRKEHFISNEIAFWTGVNVGLLGIAIFIMALKVGSSNSLIWETPYKLMINFCMLYGAAVFALSLRSSISVLSMRELIAGLMNGALFLFIGYIFASAFCGFLSLLMAPVVLGMILIFSVLCMMVAYQYQDLSSIREDKQDTLLFSIAATPALILAAAFIFIALSSPRSAEYMIYFMLAVIVVAALFRLFRKSIFNIRASMHDRWMAYLCLPIFNIEGKQFNRRWFIYGASYFIIFVFAPLVILFMTVLHMAGHSIIIQNIMDMYILNDSYKAALTQMAVIVAMIIIIFLVLMPALKPSWLSLLYRAAICCESARHITAITETPSGFRDLKEKYDLNSVLLEDNFETRNILRFSLVSGMHRACYIAHVFSALEKPRRKQYVESVQRCESSAGGFGVWAGAAPRLSSTYWALSVLRMCSALKEVNISRHCQWINSCMTKAGLFACKWSSRDLLEESYYALSSLSLMGSTDALDKKECAAQIMHAWRMGDRTEQKTYYCVKSLAILNQLDSENSEEFIQIWLAATYSRVKRMNLNVCASDVLYYIKIIMLLDRASDLCATDYIPSVWPKQYEYIFSALCKELKCIPLHKKPLNI